VEGALQKEVEMGEELNNGVIQLSELVIDAYRDHNWWPFGDIADIKQINKQIGTRQYLHKDRQFTVQHRYFHAYSGYMRTNHTVLPDGKRNWEVNVNKPPPRFVTDAFLDMLQEEAKTHSILRWRHAYECYPWVADHLKSLFKLCIIEFGDDAPHSSKHKTFPNLHGFHALMHNMLVADQATGETVPDWYQSRGINYTALVLLGPSSGIQSYINRTGFTIEDKADLQYKGNDLLTLYYIGSTGPQDHGRGVMSAAMNQCTGEDIILHGSGMRDGADFTKITGEVCGPHYSRAMFTWNWPVSSIFNARFSDAFLFGAIQIIHDRHGELSHIGMKAGEHCLTFDGTAAHLWDIINEWKQPSMANRRRDMVLKGHAKILEVIKHYSHDAAYAKLLYDHREQLQ